MLAFERPRPHSATSSRLEVKGGDMDITEVSRRSGLPASTLRYYEERGLIVSIGRRGLKRVFDSRVLERLSLVSLGVAAGFNLDEIARMFRPDGRPAIDRRLLAAKAKELDSTIRKLGALRDGLRHAAACPAPSHLECPTFRRLMAVASAEAGRKKSSRTRKSADKSGSGEKFT
jgi:DNA-binding transcriptional MerR regulator